MNEEVKTNRAPKALGPYAQAVKSGKTLYCSGQIGINPMKGKLVSDSNVEEQAVQALNNLKEVLEAAQMTPKDVVKVTVFMTNIADFKAVNEIYANFFADNECLPARSAVGVQALPAGALVEVEAVARKNN
ncbi:RidA family protein [Lentilactobacillus hilgardii]|uniref:RidA family protein n=1 Tax=Lentilactobacillus hilgardii TaxID=1588 RepID=UPI0039EAFB45